MNVEISTAYVDVQWWFAKKNQGAKGFYEGFSPENLVEIIRAGPHECRSERSTVSEPALTFSAFHTTWPIDHEG